MKYILFIVAIFSFIQACRNETGLNKESSATGSANIMLQDTIIEYNIDGISLEGARVQARYLTGLLKTCTISIYGETGKVIIDYTFNGNRILVSEKQYVYREMVNNVKSPDDIKLNKKISYVSDTSGHLLSEADSGHTDIFTEFRKVVPLRIR